MKADLILEAQGLACPMPVVRTRKAMGELKEGQILQVIATDKGAKSDLTAWSKSQGHELLEMREENEEFIFFIKKG